MTKAKKILNFKDGTSTGKKKIYRYTSFYSLLNLVTQSKNELSKVSCWKAYDPYENVFFEFPIRNGTEVIYLDKLTEHYYGQCWSLETESDIMWQVYRYRYAAMGGAVKLETTIDRLYDSCRSENYRYLGKVVYLDKNALVKHCNYLKDDFESLLLTDGGSGEMLARELLIKRIAYRSEREVRLLVAKFDFKDVGEYPSSYKYDIAPRELLTKIVFDPKIEPVDFIEKKNQLLASDEKLKVTRSNLYKLDSSEFT